VYGQALITGQVTLELFLGGYKRRCRTDKEQVSKPFGSGLVHETGYSWHVARVWIPLDIIDGHRLAFSPPSSIETSKTVIIRRAS